MLSGGELIIASAGSIISIFGGMYLNRILSELRSLRVSITEYQLRAEGRFARLETKAGIPAESGL